MSSRPTLQQVQESGDYERVPAVMEIDTAEDSDTDERQTLAVPKEKYQAPNSIGHRLATHLRKRPRAVAVFMLFCATFCLGILALVSFIPPCTLNGLDHFSQPVYSSIQPRLDIIPKLNMSLNGSAERLDAFYDEYIANVTQREYRIALLGDSLVGAMYINYPLEFAIKMYLPHFKFKFLPFDVSGSRVADIRSRLDPVIAAKPDGTFIFFDSDECDIEEYRLSRSKVAELRDAYRTDLSYVIQTLNASNPTGYLALAGPSVVGEGPLFGPVPIWSYNHKKIQLDQYRDINYEIAQAHQIPYLDVRASFKTVSDKFQGRLGYSGCLTTDGNHENEIGATVVAYLLARSLLPWLMEQIHARAFHRNY